MGNRTSQKIKQTILSLLRIFGIDLYSLYCRHAPSFNLHKTISKTQPLREDGITLAFDVSIHNSHAQVGRDFLKKISETSIPFGLFDTHLKGTSPAIIPQEETEAILKYYKKANQRRIIHFSSEDILYSSKATVIATPFWEFEDGMITARPDFFKRCKKAIVFSDFCMNAILKDAPSSFEIYKLPYPFPLHTPVFNKKTIRKRFNIPLNSFSVFYNFSLGAGMDRKNPIGAIDAFRQAFPSGNTTLVLKVSSSSNCSNGFDALCSYAAKVGLSNRLIIITDSLIHDDILALTGSCDAYLSLHRGEGLGLGMLEAMAVNVPVIATAYGGNMEFCNSDTFLPVPYNLIKSKTDFKPYRGVTKWADPNLAVAAEHLKYLFNNPEFSKKLTTKARSFITNHYNTPKFESELLSLLPKL